ncbi:MAG: molybdopterin-guanine dinucleotide biosynthesis protein B [Pirellulaceae bacterium]
MNCLHVVGRKNHGKTTLIVELVQEFCRRGIRVGTIKHSRHVHELDTPGKDSYRHRQAGGQPAAIVTQNSIGVFLPLQGESVYQRLEPLFVDCQVVIVEGHIDAPGMKIEVWREAMGCACLAGERADIVAVVTDSHPELSVPVWPRSDIRNLTDRVSSLMECARVAENRGMNK